MEDEIKKHREARKHSEELFRKIDRTREHFIDAAKNVTEAEKHLEEVEKERMQTEQAIRQTEGRLKNTGERVAQVHEDIRKRKSSKPETTNERTSKTPTAKR